MNRFASCSLGMALFLSVVSCAVNPVSGTRELMLISESQELQLGHQTDKQVVEQYGLYQDAALASRLDGLCKKLGKLSHRPHLPYQCKILDTPVVNAFAVPGGYVYFTRGILAHLNSEAELAGVMGHELGHVTARHSASQMSKAQLAQLGLGVGMIFSDGFRRFAQLAQFGVGMLFLKFSRDNERQADDLGVEYATKGGYDAAQMADFFKTLEGLHGSSDRSGLPDWFSTHPDPEDRQAAVRQKASVMRQALGLKNPKIGRESYLEAIDGLTFGENPREGYVEGQVFYHPELRFQFPIPSGWSLQNTRTVVKMTSSGRDAALLFTLASEGTPQSAGNRFIRKTGALILNSAHRQVNGLSVYRVTSRLAANQGLLQILSHFIAKDGNVYAFHGVCAALKYPDHRGTFQRVLEAFKPLKDAQNARVEPARIRIRSAPVSGSLKEVLVALAMPHGKLKALALLNGRALDDPVPKNTRLKIVEGTIRQ